MPRITSNGVAKLVDKEAYLAEPYAVFASAGTLHGDGAGDHACVERFGASDVVGIRWVD